MALTVKAAFGHDLEKLRRDLDAVEVGLGRLVGEVAKEELTPVLAEVAGLLPHDPLHRGWRGKEKRQDPGHISDSVRGSTDATGLLVYSSHPGGPVHWWGGTIEPRQHTIEIHSPAGAGREFVSKEAEAVGRRVDDALDRLMTEHGL